MSITYRQANDTDLEPTTQIVADAINDLRARHGTALDFGSRPPSFQPHCLATDSGGLWVAEHNEQLVGFGIA